MKRPLKAHRGSSGNWVLYGLIAVIMALGGYVIARSVESQQQVAVTFVGWYEDKPGYDKALADLKQTKKPMLVYLYATWCPHCKQFTAQVLADPQVQKFVQAYPHVRIAPDNGKAEMAIMQEYGAKGYPSFYVVMPNKRKVEIDTHTSEAGRHRLKTPKEFMRSILEATGGK